MPSPIAFLPIPPSPKALGEIDHLLGKDVSKGKLTEAAAREARARIVPLPDLRDLKALEREEAVELIMEVGSPYISSADAPASCRADQSLTSWELVCLAKRIGTCLAPQDEALTQRCAACPPRRRRRSSRSSGP